MKPQNMQWDERKWDQRFVGLYKELAETRKEYRDVLSFGAWRFIARGPESVAFSRYDGNRAVVAVLNRNAKPFDFVLDNQVLGMFAGAVFFWFCFRHCKERKVVLEEKQLVSSIPSILLVSMIVGLAICSFFNGGLSAASSAVVILLAFYGLFWYHFSQKKSWHDSG